MTDQEQTIDHLRSVIKTMQSKLEYRTFLLAQVIPHLQYYVSPLSTPTDLEEGYVWFEIAQKYGKLIEQFKDEYAKENGVGSSDKAELRG